MNRITDMHGELQAEAGCSSHQLKGRLWRPDYKPHSLFKTRKAFVIERIPWLSIRYPIMMIR